VNTTTATLPAPPHGDTHYSVVTLAKLLCVTPDTVDALIDDGDVRSIRLFVTYADANGEPLGDVWLEDYAAERIAAQLPAGLLARRIHTLEDAANLGTDQVLDITRHLVAQFGGAS
jgi:hypothetical protein